MLVGHQKIKNNNTEKERESLTVVEFKPTMPRALLRKSPKMVDLVILSENSDVYTLGR